MKVKNTSSKVISIGSIVVMPDGDANITEAQAKTPAVKCFVDKGWLVLEKPSTKADGKKPDDKKVDDKKVDDKKADGKEPAEGKENAKDNK